MAKKPRRSHRIDATSPVRELAPPGMVHVDRVLVMKPDPKPEFTDRRVELAYEVKALALALTALYVEAGELKLDVLFSPYFDPGRGGIAVNTQVSVRLLR